MAVQVTDYLELLPALIKAHEGSVWVTYDAEGDVLYVSFTQPNVADYSDEIERDVLARYDVDGKLIGYTVLNASLHTQLRSA
jgi:uncharacterized protein YuzE